MRTTPASLGQKAVRAILATIPPVAVAAAIIFGTHYWSAHFGAAAMPLALFASEPANANGSLIVDGTVTWGTVEDGHNAAIRADLAIPVEGTHIVLTFRKNTDATLPASHLIEITATALPGSPAGAVAKIGDLVAKASPDDTGKALVANVVDVTQTLFWIGLSPASADRILNLRLLAAATFFDLPVTYESGERASITFAKGRTGVAIFQKVLTAWGL